VQEEALTARKQRRGFAVQSIEVQDESLVVRNKMNALVRWRPVDPKLLLDRS
jgi:hypothetical protein